jgi:hypothetical protein
MRLAKENCEKGKDDGGDSVGAAPESYNKKKSKYRTPLKENSMM